MKKLIVFLCMALFITISCSKDEEPGGGGGGGGEDPCEGTSFTYSNDAATIINSSCALAGCHVAGNSAGLPDYSTYQGIFDKRTAAASRVAAGTMPPSSANITLSAAQKNVIACWVAAGAPQ